MTTEKIEGAGFKLLTPVAGKIFDERAFAVDDGGDIGPDLGDMNTEVQSLLSGQHAVGAFNEGFAWHAAAQDA